MTTTPDPRPRCGGQPGKPASVVWKEPTADVWTMCPGCSDCDQAAPQCAACDGTGRVSAPCPDGRRGCAVYHSQPCPNCQPAPTPSGDGGARWRCSRCGEYRVVTAVVGEGDEGVACTVEPPCAGMVDCERNGVSDLHEPNETCPGPEGTAWCPFDGADDYGSQDVEAVLAIKSAVRKSRAESAVALQEARTSERLMTEDFWDAWRKLVVSEAALQEAHERAERLFEDRDFHEDAALNYRVRAERAEAEVVVLRERAEESAGKWIGAVRMLRSAEAELESERARAEGAIGLWTDAEGRLAGAMDAWQETEARAGRTFGLLQQSEAEVVALRDDNERLRRFMESAYVTIHEFPHEWSRCGCKSTPILHGGYQMGAAVEHGEHCPLAPAACRPVPDDETPPDDGCEECGCSKSMHLNDAKPGETGGCIICDGGGSGYAPFCGTYSPPVVPNEEVRGGV